MKDSSGRDGEYEQLQHVIDQKDATIAEKEQRLRQCREELTQQIQQKDQEIQQFKRDVERQKNQAIQEKERELGRVNQQLEGSERLIADFGRQNTELEEELRVMRNQVQEEHGGAKAGVVSVSNIEQRWRMREKAPCEMFRACDAVIDNNLVYCKYEPTSKLYAYHIPSSSWSPIPDCPTEGFTIAIIDGILTTVGGFGDGAKKYTNKLFSLIGKSHSLVPRSSSTWEQGYEGSGTRYWTEKFPAMPTKHYAVSTLCTGTALIVMEGAGDKDQTLKIVEVLNNY